MNMQEAIQSQLLAALKMLKQAVVKCPPAVWNASRDKDKFWYKAAHALYWSHRFLQATTRDFVPQKGHRNPESGNPVSKPAVLGQLAFIEQQVAGRGLAFRQDQLEQAIAGIRHIQQHTGELYERLGVRANARLSWTEEVHRKRR